MTKPKILFVDDEQSILDSFRLLLRPMRNTWDMEFVPGGAQALALLEHSAFDVVVTDMRMPDMDGAQLLAEVARKSPQAVRMILSGYSDQDSVLRTVRLAHQYLSKPCPPEELREAIGKALSLRGVIGSKALKQLICRIDALPSLPLLYRQLMGELQNDNSSLQRIGDIISKDMGMSTSMLRLVNSSFFGLATHVSSVHHAVKLLGVETIRVLVLSIELFSSCRNPALPAAELERLAAHCLRSACFSRAVAEVELMSAAVRDDCFIAGLLHDLGKLVLGCTLGEEYARLMAEAERQKRPLHVLEREAFGTTHAEAGAYLLSLWGFKDAITEAVCWHHDPERFSCAAFSPLAAVAVADFFDNGPARPGAQADAGFHGGENSPDMTRADYTARLQDWRSLCGRARSEES